MMVDRLILENFKRFRSEEIHFQDGITGILGNNGTGKSSIVQAIFFALYGVQGTGIDPGYLISAFAQPREVCTVRLDFRMGGEAYSVIRTLKRGKTIQHDANLYKERLKLAAGVTPVDREVRKILGMGPTDFTNTVYAAQKDLLTLLENTPGKRKEWFLKALGIDYLNTESQKLLKNRVDARERDLQLAEGELKGMKNRYDPGERVRLQESACSLKAALIVLGTARADQQKERTQVQAELVRIRADKTEYMQQIERQRSLRREIDALSVQKTRIESRLRDIASLEQEYHALQALLHSYPERKREQERFRAKKAEYDRCTAEFRLMMREIDEKRRRAGILGEKMAAIASHAGRADMLRTSLRQYLATEEGSTDSILEQMLEARHTEIQQTIGRLSHRQNTLVTEWKKLGTDREEIRQAGPDGRCPLCGQTLGAHYTQIEQEFAARRAALEQDALAVYQEQEQIEKEKALLQEHQRTFRELRSLVETLRTQETLKEEEEALRTTLQVREAELADLEVRITGLQWDPSDFARTEAEMAELDTRHLRYTDLGQKMGAGTALQQQRSDLESTITGTKATLAEVTNAIAHSPFKPEEEVRREDQLGTIDSSLREIEGAWAAQQVRLRHLQEQIEERTRAEQQILELGERIEKIQEEADLLKLTRASISDYMLYLLQVVRSRLETEVSRIVSDITSGRYEQVLLDEDFNILVRDVDDDYPVDRFSGGEQDDVAVALRIALSRYLAELHQVQESTLLIFDEIFGSQDEERRAHLLSALRTQESRFPQIILISHISEIQGEFGTSLMVEMGSDLTSTVREVHEGA